MSNRAPTLEEVNELLKNPNALLSRSHLRALGMGRRAIEAVFRHCPIVALPGYMRPLIRVSDYNALLEANTYRGDRVRPSFDRRHRGE